MILSFEEWIFEAPQTVGTLPIFIGSMNLQDFESWNVPKHLRTYAQTDTVTVTNTSYQSLAGLPRMVIDAYPSNIEGQGGRGIAPGWGQVKFRVKGVLSGGADLRLYNETDANTVYEQVADGQFISAWIDYNETTDPANLSFQALVPSGSGTVDFLSLEIGYFKQIDPFQNNPSDGTDLNEFVGLGGPTDWDGGTNEAVGEGQIHYFGGDYVYMFYESKDHVDRAQQTHHGIGLVRTPINSFIGG